MTVDLGNSYLSHYERFFGPFSDHKVYRMAEGAPAIQVLEYPKVFPGCRVFCSLGLSHYSAETNAIGEVFMPVDGGWESVSRMLAEALFFLVRQRMTFGRGTAIGGLENIDMDFVRRWRKSAIYLTMPFGLPKGFEDFPVGNDTAHMLLGIFIPQSEYQYFSMHGTERYEDLLQAKGIDPFVLGRASCV